ncbi:ricin B lectin domain-containing protein [Nemania sp. FL0031]|nr:ricin B lectin domain-containing protein [Nemania sp. FL0031]
MGGPAEGLYIIRNVAAQTVLTVGGSNDLVGSKLTFDKVQLQLFAVKIIGVNDSTYLITQAGTTNVVDLFNSESADGTHIISFPVHCQLNQQWVISATSTSNVYKIKSKSSNKVVDLTNSETADNTAVINFHDHDGQNQLWEFKKIGPYSI